MVLIGFLGLCLLAALADLACAAPGLRHWYPAMRHPLGPPPGLVFLMGWMPLSILVAVAAWRVWRWDPLLRLRDPAGGRAGAGGVALRRRGLQLWSWQLAAGALWMPLLFGLHRPQTALALILSLGLLVGLTIRDFRRMDRVAGAMMSVSLAWVCYAAWLNAGIAWLNPA